MTKFHCLVAFTLSTATLTSPSQTHAYVQTTHIYNTEGDDKPLNWTAWKPNKKKGLQKKKRSCNCFTFLFNPVTSLTANTHSYSLEV